MPRPAATINAAIMVILLQEQLTIAPGTRQFGANNPALARLFSNTKSCLLFCPSKRSQSPHTPAFTWLICLLFWKLLHFDDIRLTASLCGHLSGIVIYLPQSNV